MPSRVAEILLEAARQQGEGMRERGRIWGGMAEQLGQIPNQMVAQQQAQERIKGEQQQREYRGLHIGQLKSAMASEKAAQDLWPTLPKNEAGDFDVPGSLDLMMTKGVLPDHAERFGKTLETLNAIKATDLEHKRNGAGDVANSIISTHTEGAPYDANEVMVALTGAQAKGLISPADVRQRTLELASGKSPEQILKEMRASAPAYQKLVPRTEYGLVREKTGEEVVPPAMKEESVPELGARAIGATGQEMPGILTYNKKAERWHLNGQPLPVGVTVQPKATPGTEKDRAIALLSKQNQGLPLTAQEQADLKAYEQEKLIGPESAQAAATERQTRTIGAQIGMEGLREKNRRQEVGLKELTDKVELPYQSALAQAQTLRDTVAAARSGNKIAASMQSLETAMAAIRAQGLNRINTVEIGMPASAGNTWDHIVGWFGQRVEGQPIPANIQKDMEEFATVLEKGARQKYEQGHKSITKRYELNETLVPPPTPSAASAPPAAAAGRTRVVGPNGQTGTVPDGTALPPGWKKQ